MAEGCKSNGYNQFTLRSQFAKAAERVAAQLQILFLDISLEEVRHA